MRRLQAGFRLVENSRGSFLERDMKTPIVWGEPETRYLRRFFDAVDAAVSAELQMGRSINEESLTFLLGRLLDGQSTFQRMLDYSLDTLNADLLECGTGSQVSVEFTTNEHTKAFEGAVSYADLGIVVRREHSVLGPAYTKALIVQSKKLYPDKGEYGVFSRYDGFDKAQFSQLKAIASKYDWSGVAYFLYNPKLEALVEQDREIVKALEARFFPDAMWPHAGMPFWHPEMDYFLHKMLRHGFFPPAFSASPSTTSSTDEIRKQRSDAIAQKPGLRVMGITSVGDIVESDKKVRGTFSLKECYQHALSERWWGNSGAVPFLSLSSYVVSMFMGCVHGSDNDNIVRIAEGKIPLDNGKGPNGEDDTPGIAVRHTLRITVRSTLPHVDMTFFEQ